MNFFDKLIELNYDVVKRDKEEILIKKKYDIADIYIYFDISNKQITGSISTNKLLYNIDDIAEHYKIYREMRADLETFRELSKYEVLNK